MKSFQVSCKKFTEERPWTRPSEKGLERKGSTYVHTYSRASSKESIANIAWWESGSLALPRPLQPVARENLLPPPCAAEWGGPSRVGGRGTARCRSFTTAPVQCPLHHLFISAWHASICQTLQAARARGEDGRSAILDKWLSAKLKRKEKRIPRYFSLFATDSYSRECRGGRKEGRKAVRAFVPLRVRKRVSRGRFFLPRRNSFPPPPPLSNLLSRLETSGAGGPWLTRKIVPGRLAANFPPSPLLSVSPRLLLAPGLRRKEKNPIVALDRMEGVEKTHRSNRYFISLCLSLSLYLSHSITPLFLSLPLFTRK